MMPENRFTIVTCYHFDSSHSDAYARLLRSLRASVREVGNNGRVILVANGTEDGAEDPARVIRDLDASRSAKIDPVALASNADNVGGLNAGVAMALAFPLDADREWIASVQSSATLQRGWLEQAAACLSDEVVGGVFGRVLLEDDVDSIWADGHVVCAGRTRNENYLKDVKSAEPVNKTAFPCLSAAVFRKSLVAEIVRQYGNFVCENLPHYGDCTDVAIRAKSVSAPNEFRYCVKAVAHKRRPSRDRKREQCYQLVAAGLYYDGKTPDTERRVKEKCAKQWFVDTKREADERLRRPYSWTGKTAPPAPATLDRCWGKTSGDEAG